MNHNFADLNSVMWTAIELETDRSKLINHYFPIPEMYTSEEAFVSFTHVYLQNNSVIESVMNRLHVADICQSAKCSCLLSDIRFFTLFDTQISFFS